MTNRLRNLNLILLLLILNTISYAGNKNALYYQTVRGKVIDQDTQIPIIGANVVIVNINPTG